MPTYQYRCRDCESVFEVTQRITEAPLTKCGECGGRVRRVIQPVGIIFKGSGFHINDYPNSKGRKRSDTPPPSRDESSTTGASSGASPESPTGGKPEEEAGKKPDGEAGGKPNGKPGKNGTSA